MIGTCGFTKIDDENKVAEIGYVLNPDYWNLGLATEAAEIVIEFAFETMKMHRVEAKFMFGNDASLSVMKKLGMKFEGYHRDSMLVKGKYRTIGYASILSDEYYRKV
jgi:ribosomal-protein-alanine N-acetyltransferase